jgi:tetratricopeptide (TPR) repeat protein
VYFVATVAKSQALLLFINAQQASTKQDYASSDLLLDQAIRRYQIDVFYRLKLENAIARAQELVRTTQTDQEVLKNQYLANAQGAVDNGLLAVQTNPSNYQNYVALGRAYELAIPFDKEGGYTRAKQAYGEAIKLYSENPFLYVMMARLEAVGGTKEAVRVALNQALEKKKNFADAFYLMSQFEASEKNIDQAIAYAIEAVKNAPNDPATYLQAGYLFYGKKDYANAIDAFQYALQYAPNNANIAYSLAVALRDGGKPDVAKQIADELAKRAPTDPDIKALVRSLEPAPKEPVSTKKK